MVYWFDNIFRHCSSDGTWFKTGYLTLSSLKMPSDSLIQNAQQLAFQSQCFAGLTSSQDGVLSWNFLKFYSGVIVLVHERINQCKFK